MNISKTQQGSVTIVNVAGSLDALTAPKLTEFLASEIGAGNVKLVADLSGLEYSSSAGLRVILNATKESRQKSGDMRLSSVQPNVQKILEMSGFTSILKFYPNVDEAVKSFG